ncbi:hypothetical protein PIIN_07706 [Serendipita indica DSM 11827]|uniref:Uncharacterized protein n=1 Tax=Serendipita indica (strain DSM 11827) TaxID=1109443 RepID=G4TR08_SERID|nr:hypothetical protein PIIN_07706 [Serendipita indica DSM 11827]
MSEHSIESVVAAIPQVYERFTDRLLASSDDRKTQALLAKTTTQAEKHLKTLTLVINVADRCHNATSQLCAALSNPATINVRALQRIIEPLSTETGEIWKKISENEASILSEIPRNAEELSKKMEGLLDTRENSDKAHTLLKDIQEKVQELARTYANDNLILKLPARILIPAIGLGVDVVGDITAWNKNRLLRSIQTHYLAIEHLFDASDDLNSFLEQTRSLLSHWDSLAKWATEIAAELSKSTHSFDLRWSDLPQRAESLRNEFYRYKSIGIALFQTLHQHSWVTG